MGLNLIANLKGVALEPVFKINNCGPDSFKVALKQVKAIVEKQG